MKETEHDCCCHHGHDEGHGCGCGHRHAHNEEHHCCCGHHECECEAKDGELYDRIRKTIDKYDCTPGHEETEHEAAHIIEHGFDENNTADVKKFLLGCLELTSLKVTDNEESILSMVEKVNSFPDAYPELPHIAGICVYPNFVHLVSNSLEEDGVNITSVSAGFPSAQTFSEVKLVETALALRDGADEIDMVLPVGKFLSDDLESVDEEIEEVKSYCGKKKLKVILETSALQTPEKIMRAAVLAMYCGADFVKTSTGKLSIGATPAAVYAMCQAIKQYNKFHNYKIGIKIAGGVKTAEDAIKYYTIVKDVLGKEWLTPELFRIGASGLANSLIGEITNSEVKYF